MTIVPEFAGPLPSFTEQIAVVYNDYLDTLGGGERSAIAFALALRDLGYTVEIACRNAIPSRDRMESLFGESLSGINFSQPKTNYIASYYGGAGVSVWVNHTYMSFDHNPAKIGIYALMFPQWGVSRRSDPMYVRALETYRAFAANSTYTETYGRALWEVDSSRFCTLHPPISATHVDHALALTSAGRFPLAKKKSFIHLGRFNPNSHSKNQKILIEGFLAARASNPRLADWTLTCVGNVNSDEESRAYFAACEDLARRSGGAVRIETGVPFKRVGELLSESFGYVHGTGAFVPPGEQPSVCEHLGLAILEAMAHGCVPLVYGRGGIFDFLEPGISGLCYFTPEGLEEGYDLLARYYDSPDAGRIQAATLATVPQAGFESFKRRLATLIVQGPPR